MENMIAISNKTRYFNNYRKMAVTFTTPTRHGHRDMDDLDTCFDLYVYFELLFHARTINVLRVNRLPPIQYQAKLCLK